MAKGSVRELLKKYFAVITINSFLPPFIPWFFIGYWILYGAEFLFRPFFLSAPLIE